MLTVYGSCGVCHIFHVDTWSLQPMWCDMCKYPIIPLMYQKRCLSCHRSYHPSCLQHATPGFCRLDQEERDDGMTLEDLRAKAVEEAEQDEHQDMLLCRRREPSVYVDPSVEKALDKIRFEFPTKLLPHEEKYRARKISRNRARLSTVLTIFMELMKGKDITRIQWLRPYQLYEYYLQQVERFDEAMKTCPMLDTFDPTVIDIHYANVHSTGIYGHMTMATYIMSDSPIHIDAYKRRVLKCLHWINPKTDGEIIDFYNDEGHHIPTFYIAVDHRWRHIVLSVRGTLTMNDVLLDMVNVPVEFNGGHTHRGLSYAVRCLADMTLPTIRKLQKEYPGYGVAFTGHSLGGAAVVVLHAMWKGEVIPNLRTWTFGAPPCVEGPLVERANVDLVQTVHEHDNLPRTSMEGIEALIDVLSDIDNSLATRRRVKIKPFYTFAGTRIQIWRNKCYVVEDPDILREMFFHWRGWSDHSYPVTMLPGITPERLRENSPTIPLLLTASGEEGGPCPVATPL